MTKGTLFSPSRIAVLQHLQMHGDCTREQLAAALSHHAIWAGVSGTTPSIVTPWLNSNLAHLRAQGHIMKGVNDANEPVWRIGTEPVPTVAPNDLEENLPGSKAAPRHVNVMHGPTYQPKPWAPARAGAVAHSAIPSLMGRKRVPFRSGP